MRPCLFFALCETRGWVANVRLQDGSVVQTEEWATDVTHVRAGDDDVTAFLLL